MTDHDEIPLEREESENDRRMSALAEFFKGDEKRFALHLSRARVKVANAAEDGHACLLTLNEVRALDFALRHATETFQHLKKETGT